MQGSKQLNPGQEWPMNGEQDYQTRFSERLLGFANACDIIAHKVLELQMTVFFHSVGLSFF